MRSRRTATSMARRVETWFRKSQSSLPWRDDYAPYKVWISEFMAQQTRIGVVVDYFPRFIEKFPSVESLAAAEEEDVVAAWSGLGYYARARSLHQSAREIVERFGGRLPEDAKTLQSLHGFGPYTAGAVSSIAFQQRTPLADGNVSRLAARLETIDEPWRSRALEKRSWDLAGSLVDACESPRDLNQGLMEIGARICRPKNPDCPVCPLKNHCAAYRKGLADSYPIPAPKKKAVELTIPVWIFLDSRGRLLFRRASGRLMKGMFQLPLGNDLLFADPVEIENPGSSLGSFTHTVTHRRIRFHLFEPQLPDSVGDHGGEWKWIAPEQLGEHPHPSWVRKAIELWRRVPRD